MRDLSAIFAVHAAYSKHFKPFLPAFKHSQETASEMSDSNTVWSEREGGNHSPSWDSCVSSLGAFNFPPKAERSYE